MYIILIEKKKEKKSRFPVNEDSQNNSEDFHVTGSSRETLYSDDNQNQNHPTEKTNRNRPVNWK